MSVDALALDSIKGTIADLEGVAMAKVGNEREAREAASWLDEARKVEADADEVLGPDIKAAFDAHKKLTTARKTLFEKLGEYKNRIRAQLATFIGNGNVVDGYYTRPKYVVTILDMAKVPDEYKVTTVDEKRVEDWAKQTEGKIPIAGLEIKTTHILYAKGEK